MQHAKHLTKAKITPPLTSAERNMQKRKKIVQTSKSCISNLENRKHVAIDANINNNLSDSQAKTKHRDCESNNDTYSYFSIIMANYNNSKYLDQAIESVMKQSCKNWELIIVDDASTDNSISIIKSYLHDDRIKLIEHKINKQYTSSLISGISKISYPIFGILDSDDTLDSKAVETMISAHQNNPDAGLIYSQFAYCDENLNFIKAGYCREIPEGKSNLDTDCISHFKTYKKNFYDKTDGYDTEILYAEDKDIAYKMEEISKVIFINDILYNYRMRPDSVSHIETNRATSLKSIKKSKVNAISRRYSNSIITNKEPLDCFNLSKIEFSNNNFEFASKIIDTYKSKINYMSFSKHDLRNKKKPQVSIIIVTYNNNKELVKCIESVAHQIDEKSELIIIDNGMNDAVIPFVIGLPVLYVKCPINFGPSEGRNIGVHFSRGNIVAFLDDDAVAHKNYVSSIFKAFKIKGILAIRGKILPKTESSNIANAKHYNLGKNPFPSILDIEGNTAIRKHAYQIINGMDPLLFGHEGAEFSYRLALKYKKNSSWYWPETVIYHDFASSTDKLHQKNERHKTMSSYLQFKYKNFSDYLTASFKIRSMMLSKQ
jgi:glycosyltransferase involved in cell wall biosynthesis